MSRAFSDATNKSRMAQIITQLPAANDPTGPNDPAGPNDPVVPNDPTGPNDPADPNDLLAPNDPTSPNDPAGPVGAEIYIPAGLTTSDGLSDPTGP